MSDEPCKISPEEMDQAEECRAWLSYAQTDYDCAVYLRQAPISPPPLNVICYHCQQAAEKAIKALIVFFGSQGGMPKVHDLTFLLAQVKRIAYDQKGIVIGQDLMTKADGLTRYGIAPRYPNEIDVDEQQAEKALRDSAEILNWVRRLIL